MVDINTGDVLGAYKHRLVEEWDFHPMYLDKSLTERISAKNDVKFFWYATGVKSIYIDELENTKKDNKRLVEAILKQVTINLV